MPIARYTLMDPAGGRNAFIGWMATSKRQDCLYREWPGCYEVPGHGVPGTWAQESSKKEGCNDGAAGDGQDDFGWNLLRYKFEFARLEGWTDYKTWLDMAGREPDRYWQAGYLYPTAEQLSLWDDRNGSDEPIERRIMDCRSASLKTQEVDRVSTLITRYEDIGMYWERASGAWNEEGIEAINSALFYTESETGGGKIIEPPTLVIGKDCKNTIWALQNFTGEDGQGGACKDPIDILRWFYGAGLSKMGGSGHHAIHNRTAVRRDNISSASYDREAMKAAVYAGLRAPEVRRRERR